MFHSVATLLAAAAAANNSSTGIPAASTKRRRVDFPSPPPSRSAANVQSASVGVRLTSQGVSNVAATSPPGLKPLASGSQHRNKPNVDGQDSDAGSCLDSDEDHSASPAHPRQTPFSNRARSITPARPSERTPRGEPDADSDQRSEAGRSAASSSIGTRMSNAEHVRDKSAKEDLSAIVCSTHSCSEASMSFGSTSCPAFCAY
eukprot:3594740-Pleurochrysis_carterae.AAC.2